MTDNNENNQQHSEQPHSSEDQPTSPDIQLVEARALEMEAGWRWVVAGFELFKKNPGLWIGMIIVVAIIMAVISLIPFVGSILMPIFSGGFMYICHRYNNDEPVEFTDLFHGFQNRTAPLAIIGLVNLAAAFIIGFVVIAIIGTGAGLGAIGGSEGAIAGGLIGLFFGVMVSILLYVPVAMGLWFAPALVLFHQDIKPFDAILMSFKACLKNILPFLIYSIIVFLMFILGSIPLMLGLLVTFPVVIASTYIGYRSIFTEFNQSQTSEA